MAHMVIQGYVGDSTLRDHKENFELKLWDVGLCTLRFALEDLVAEFPGPKKVNLCITMGLYILPKARGYLPSY